MMFYRIIEKQIKLQKHDSLHTRLQYHLCVLRHFNEVLQEIILNLNKSSHGQFNVYLIVAE